MPHPALAILAAAPTAQEAVDPPQFVPDSATRIALPAGFDAEVLYSVPESQGS